MAHAPHQSPSGRHRWTAEGGHCACGQGHHLTPQGDDCPQMRPIIVLRCRCGEPERHAQQGEHCPQAELDMDASDDAGLVITPVVTQ